MRAATCGCRLGAAYYHSVDPFAEARELDDGNYTIDHFPTKLLTLHERFNTDAARREADARTEFMHAFLGQLRREISP